MKEKKFYERPQTEVLDVCPERMLCQSQAACNTVSEENMELQQGEW